VSQFLITTPERVKAQRDITGSSLDSLIASLIAAVSEMAEDYLCRDLLKDTYTEERPLRARTRYVSLRAFPIESVSSVKYARTYDFSDIDDLDEGIYQVRRAQGQIYLSGISTWFDPGFIQVTYVGGIAEDTAGFIAEHPRIAQAADNEVIARLNRRTAADGSPQAINSSVAYQDELKPLTDFYAALDPHRRLRL
jgi:hypothetical protein